MLELVTKDGQGTSLEVKQSLDELARQGARRMIAEALELEVAEYIGKMRHLRDEYNHALAVRNGKGQERNVTLGAGAIGLRAPRVNDRRPRQRFSSRILPPYMRRSPRLEEALPILYLRGLSTGDFSAASYGSGKRSTRAGGSAHCKGRTTPTSGLMECIFGYAWKKIGWPAW